MKNTMALETAYKIMLKELKHSDPEVGRIVELDELNRQNRIELIPSENIPEIDVRIPLITGLARKYFEGVPGKRYYAGCELYDELEILANERFKKLYGAEHVTVQPHAGFQANLEVYSALLNIGDKILSMRMADGGHLSHGSGVSEVAKKYKISNYGVDRDTEMLDYDNIRVIAKDVEPKMIVCGYSAYPRKIDFKQFREIADDIGAYLLADISHIAGLVATGLHPDPIPYADVVTTTTHKTLRGPKGGLIMCKEEYAEQIDHTVCPGMQGGPFGNVIASKAMAAKHAATPEFKLYQELIVDTADALANALTENGHELVTGGTDTHLILDKVSHVYENMSGNKAANILEEVDIIVNKNLIPFDTKKAHRTSGIRMGTPLIASRSGVKPKDMEEVAWLISEGLKYKRGSPEAAEVKRGVMEFCEQHPITI